MAPATFDLTGKRIAITGGTGSLSRSIIDLLLKNGSPTITLISRDEMKQLEMVKQGYNHRCLRFLVGDVCHKTRMEEILPDHDYVIHCAGNRDLAKCELAPWEAFQTNVFGTQNVFEVCRNAKVDKVLFISSDKAVNPRSVYGATKLLGERLTSQVQTPLTRFSSIRFGNILGSRGGVVQKLLQQRHTGEITVTDPKMSRFSMPLNLAAHHVLKCLFVMEGGEIFVPKSPTLKLMDLVHAVSGKAQIRYIGPRQGEKLHDVLLSEEESLDTIDSQDTFILRNGSKAGTLPPGFTYQSNTNAWSLTAAEIKSLVQTFFPEARLT